MSETLWEGQILAIDPGTTHSAYVRIRGDRILGHGFEPNEQVLRWIDSMGQVLDEPLIAIEDMTCYGARVGRTTFQTLWWAGRFYERAVMGDCKAVMIPRKEVVAYHCPGIKGNDSSIIKALTARIGVKGTKKSPGPCYGVAKHVWQVLAVAVYASDMRDKGEL